MATTTDEGLLALALALALAAAVCSAPTPTPTTTPEPTSAPPEVLWSADMEEGNLSDWDGESNSGSANSIASTAQAHSGCWSAAATIRNATEAGNGTRLYTVLRDIADRNDPRNLPDEAYYSAWYYIPQFIDGNNNIMQWKQARCFEWDAQGNCTRQNRPPPFYVALRDMEPHLTSKIDNAGNFTKSPVINDPSGVLVPVGEWFKLECFYRWSMQPDGAVICWLDGREILRRENVLTQSSLVEWNHYPRQWAVNNYGVSRQDPLTHTIYIDDATISTLP